MGEGQLKNRGIEQHRSEVSRSQTTNAQTSNNWTGPSPGTRRRVAKAPKTVGPVPPRGPLAAMATCSMGVQTEDSVNGSLSPWDLPHDSHFHSHPNAG